MNFEGSYKIMEHDDILKMVGDAFHHHCFIIDPIVSDYDITMKYVTKH